MERCQNDLYRYIGVLANTVAFIAQPPTNVSNIGLNRGKYPSYYQVSNAVRMI